MKLFNSILFLLPFILFNSNDVILDTPSESLIWNDISNLESIAEADEKPILIKIHASWCRPCKMLSKTFEEPSIIKLLEDKYTLVSFDVEEPNTLNYKGKDYQYVEKSKVKYNELALEMLDNRLSFPALLVLDNNLNKISLSRGYKDKEQLMAFLSDI